MGRTRSREPSTRSSCWWRARLGSGRGFAPHEGRRPAERAGGRGAEVDAVQQLLGAGRNGRERLMGELADQAEVLAADHVLIDRGALPPRPTAARTSSEAVHSSSSSVACACPGA